jgi:hypothetical protein
MRRLRSFARLLVQCFAKDRYLVRAPYFLILESLPMSRIISERLLFTAANDIGGLTLTTAIRVGSLIYINIMINQMEDSAQ